MTRHTVMCIGGGRVGIPLALRFWQAGHSVTIVDIDTDKIESLQQGDMPFMESGCEDLLAAACRTAEFRAMNYEDPDFAEMAGVADYIIMTLGTPMGTDYTFRFDQYFDVLDRIIPHLSTGLTVIIRSTVAPHFTRNVVTARIATEKEWMPGHDFFVAFCPERLVQGQALVDIDGLPEIIGADDGESAERAARLLSTLNSHKQLYFVSTVEAELAKLVLNTYRYTLFGLANEFALAAEQFGADIYAVLQAANGGYARGGIPFPGPSRGPCLGKDTATLAFSSTTGIIGHAAIKANENVVLHIAHELRLALTSLVGRRVVILGRAFKADSDDVRDNLTDPLLNILDREGAHTGVYDPLLQDHLDPTVLRGSDAVVLMTPHDVFRGWSEADLLAKTEGARSDVFVFDMWNVWPWADRIFGRGKEDHESTGNGNLRIISTGDRTAAP